VHVRKAIVVATVAAVAVAGVGVGSATASSSSTRPIHPVRVTFRYYPESYPIVPKTYTAILPADDLVVRASNTTAIYVTFGSKWGVVYSDPNCFLAC
jgi:hypothetical protein